MIGGTVGPTMDFSQLDFFVTTDRILQDSSKHFFSRHGVGFRSDDLHITTSGNLAVFRGNIFNHIELGAKYNSLVNLFEKHGRFILRNIDGPFVLVFFDMDRNLFVARDMYGIEPLYWGTTPSGIWISNHRAYKNSKWFPQGHYCLIDTKKSDDVITMPQPIVRWAEDNFHGHLCASATYHKLIINNYLNDTIAKMYSSCEKMVVLLSGGLISTIIAVIASKIRSNIVTCTIGFKNSESFKHALYVSKFVHSKHTEIVLPPELEEEDVIHYLGAFMDAHFPMYALMTGVGAHSIWGGHAPSDTQLFEQHCQNLMKLPEKDLCNTVHKLNRMNISTFCPFLDTNMVEVCMNIHGNFKRPKDSSSLDMPSLRYVFQNELPNEILTREHKSLQDSLRG